MISDARVEGGRRGKVGGHAFEYAYAKFIGLSKDAVMGGTKTKVDIALGAGFGISVKNPKNLNTQALLTPPSAFSRGMTPPEEVLVFMDLFFGSPSPQQFMIVCEANRPHSTSLSTEDRRRQRVSSGSIPPKLLVRSLRWFDDVSVKLFDLIFTTGYSNFVGKANYLAWAWEKDNVESVKVYSMAMIRRNFHAAKWVVASSGTVLHLIHPVFGKLMHLQMKGSGKKNSWEYHSMMFHVWRPILNSIQELSKIQVAAMVRSNS